MADNSIQVEEVVYEFDAFYRMATFHANGDMRLELRIPAREVKDMLMLTQSRGLRLLCVVSHAVIRQPGIVTAAELMAQRNALAGGS